MRSRTARRAFSAVFMLTSPASFAINSSASASSDADDGPFAAPTEV